MERLQKSCYKLVWLNPLLRFKDFLPKSISIKRILLNVDAFLPRAGECAWDILTWQPEAFETLKIKDKPWQVEPVDPDIFFPELKGYNMDRLTPMTIRTHTDPLPDATNDIPGTYIQCTQEPFYFGEVAERAKSDGMKHIAIEAGHIVIMTHPNEIADILLEAANAD